MAPNDMVCLVFGKTGWMGGMVGEEMRRQGIKFEYANARLEDRGALLADIERVKPTHVVNCAGKVGTPNVDWCETHKVETLRSNVLGVLNLADVCLEKGLHLTNFATGCIYEYDKDFPLGSGKGFKEDDTPNFLASYYSRTRAAVESMLKDYPNVLTLRLRMPITADLVYPRNFIAKIMRYEKVIDIPNSMTVLPELLPIALEMAQRKLTGVINFTNPGAISHNEVLQLYKDYVDQAFTWANFTVEEQAKVIVAPRSNNLLDTGRLQSEFPALLPIRESLIKYVFAPAATEKGRWKAAVDAMRAEAKQGAAAAKPADVGNKACAAAAESADAAGQAVTKAPATPGVAAVVAEPALAAE